MELKQILHKPGITPVSSLVDGSCTGLRFRLVQPRAVREQNGDCIQIAAPYGLIQWTCALSITSVDASSFFDEISHQIQMHREHSKVQGSTSGWSGCAYTSTGFY